jgi:hypothetical protein
MKTYYPYKADDGKHKYYIITNTGKKVYFGANGYNDYIIYNSKFGREYADKKKKAYIARHKVNENWSKSGINTAGFWSLYLLWNKTTLTESYEDVKKRFLS